MLNAWIFRWLLPSLWVLLPIVGLGLIIVAIPPEAARDYVQRLRQPGMDWLILGLGLALFAVQTFYAWHSLRWLSVDFNTRHDRFLSHIAQAAEWFPLLGLLGTVAAILQTFQSFGGTAVTPGEIIRKYAPAITATGSGLLMALLNILPTWIVTVGRDVIRGQAGGQAVTDAADIQEGYIG